MGLFRRLSTKIGERLLRERFAHSKSRGCLTLGEYRALIRSLPVPTHSQLCEFATFVAGAHSWYKHLPLLPPGAPMQFFLDPAAGMQLERDTREGIRATRRDQTGFHYSWIKTDEYRERFGHLAFSRSAGTSVSLQRADGTQLVPSDDAPYVFDPARGRIFQVPDEVTAAGRAFVSGAVHTLGADVRLWWYFVLRKDRAVDWPEQSGGADAFDKIRQRCRGLVEGTLERERRTPEDLGSHRDYNICMVDYPLYELLEPERRRQRAGMVAAMERVIDLVMTDRA
jgi:hypothetical protein